MLLSFGLTLSTIGGRAYDALTARLRTTAGGLGVGLLGPVEAVVDGRPAALGGQRQRALLAVLALRANTFVPRTRIVDALWGERPPASAANALQVAVHGLRKSLGADRIETRGAAYRLRLDPGELDLDRFSELAGRAGGAPAEAAATLAAALGLWRGEALADLDEPPFAREERARLEDLRLGVLERRIDADLACGRHDALVGELERLVREDPYRERFRAQLMLALYRSGRQADALDAYRRARSDLVDALGVEPSPALQELERAILRQDASLEAPHRGRRRALPEPPTALVGRELELVAVAAMLREPDVRLVTLTGAGGTGKTRLAIAVAAELEPELADGACFVGLAALRDPELVGSTIARALEVPERPGEPVERVLAEALCDRRLLLVLDNFERLPEAAPLVASLLAAAPGLRVLATSRTPLRLRGEHEYPVPPLSVPRRDARGAGSVARSPAVELFVSRARAVRGDFRLDERTAPVVAEICRSLDGLPLALELAAARTNVLAPADLLVRLENRLDVLTAGPRDLPARQQTLRATVDWSHELLDERARALFAALAVFSGGCTLEAATTVCDGDLDGVSALLDQSLLRRDDGGGELRFRMLETVREYARERLAALPAAARVRRRHAEHFLALAEQAEPHLTGPEAPAWLDRLELEHDNLRAALTWAGAAPERHELELRLATALQYFWRVRGHLSEGRRWLEAAVERGHDAPAGVRGKALGATAIFVDRYGEHGRARRLYDEALVLFREAGDDGRVARTLSDLGGLSILEEDYARAIELYDETIPLFRESGDVRALSVTLSNLAAVLGLQGDHRRAHQVGLDALAISREHGDRDQMAISLHNLGRYALARSAWEESGAFFAESLELGGELGYRELLANCLLGCGELAVAQDDPASACRLLGAGAALFAELGVPPGPEEQEGEHRAVERLREQLGPDELELRLQEGRQLAWGDAVREAVELARSIASR